MQSLRKRANSCGKTNSLVSISMLKIVISSRLFVTFFFTFLKFCWKYQFAKVIQCLHGQTFLLFFRSKIHLSKKRRTCLAFDFGELNHVNEQISESNEIIECEVADLSDGEFIRFCFLFMINELTSSTCLPLLLRGHLLHSEQKFFWFFYWTEFWLE